MNKLPITNLKKWKKNNLGNYIFFKPNKSKPFLEEGFYFNYYVFHFIIHTTSYQKEGIEIKYLNSLGNDIEFKLFSSLIKFIGYDNK